MASDTLQDFLRKVRVLKFFFIRCKISILLGFLLAIFMSALTFLVKSSRPTADDYLIAPLLHGFYIDAGTPDRLLFRPTNNLISDFFSATLAAYRLGWDSPLNFAIFQMIPATLLNYIGKSSTSILCIFYFSVAFLSIQSSISARFAGKRERTTVSLMIILGLMFSILITDFGSEKRYFGIYSLTGIRFGLYWVQPLLTFSAFVFLLRNCKMEKSNHCKKMFIFFLVPAFCSLWASVFWIILISLYLLFSLIEKKQSKNLQVVMSARKLFQGLAISIFTALLGMIYILRPAVDAGRFIGENGQILNRIEQNGSNFLDGFLRVIPFWKLGFWQIAFAAPLVCGFAIGLMISKLRIVHLSRNFNIQISPSKKVVLPLASSLFLSALVIYTFIFHFMEFFTYPAWWHRGTPSSLGYFGGLILGVEIGPRLLRNFRRTGFLVAILVFALAIVKTPYVLASVNSLETFADNWDKGDLLGLGTPVQNNADYICVEIAQISPHKLTCHFGEN